MYYYNYMDTQVMCEGWVCDIMWDYNILELFCSPRRIITRLVQSCWNSAPQLDDYFQVYELYGNDRQTKSYDCSTQRKINEAT